MTANTALLVNALLAVGVVTALALVIRLGYRVAGPAETADDDRDLARAAEGR